MKKYFFIVCYMLGGFFGACALDISIRWISGAEPPFPDSIKKNSLIPIGTIFLLPAVAFILIRFGNRPKIDRVLAIIILTLWLMASTRLIAAYLHIF